MSKRPISPSSSSSPTRKRQRMDSSTPAAEDEMRQPLPPAVLLLSMPKLLIQPPSHPQHELSLCLSILALRKCLKTTNLSAVDECRCHTGIAEIGLIALRGGFAEKEDSLWAEDLLGDVERSISQGLVLAQKHPALYLYTPHLTLLSSQLAEQQGNMKFARAALNRMMNNTTYPRYPADVVYAAYLDNISFLIANPSPSNAALSRSASPTKTPTRSRPVSPLKPKVDEKAQQDTNRRQILHILGSLRTQALNNAHTLVVTLCDLVKLRLLIRWGLWAEVGEMVQTVEEALNLTGSHAAPAIGKENAPGSQAAPTPGTSAPLQNSNQQPGAVPAFQDKPADSKANADATNATPTLDVPYHIAMLQAHALILAITYHVYTGSIPKDHVTPRLSRLHVLLDSGLFDIPDERVSGLVQLPLSECANARPLLLRLTPPAIITSMTYLISAVSKRDPVGRNPKRGVFAREGLLHLENELALGTAAQTVPDFASKAELSEAHARVSKIQADLMLEGIALDISRSSFAPARRSLDALIAHLRSHGIWECYAARVTLLEGYLAHGEAGWMYTLLLTDEELAEARAKAEATMKSTPKAKGQSKNKKKQDAKIKAGNSADLSNAANLTEARRKWGRARDCYRVAATLAKETGDNWLCAAAKAAGLALRLGLEAMGERTERWRPGSEGEEDVEAADEDDIDKFARAMEDAQVVKECHGMGGILSAVGRVLQASLNVQEGTATLGAKASLRSALTLTTNAQENYLRALVLAMCSSHYLLTAEEHASEMLEACSNIACGLGVGPKKGVQAQGSASSAQSQGIAKDASSSSLTQDPAAPADGNKLGNVPLRLWCGERRAELYARNGDEENRGKALETQQAIVLAARTKMREQSA